LAIKPLHSALFLISIILVCPLVSFIYTVSVFAQKPASTLFWNTYKNVNCELSIKYPSNWQFEEATWCFIVDEPGIGNDKFKKMEVNIMAYGKEYKVIYDTTNDKYYKKYPSTFQKMLNTVVVLQLNFEGVNC
jgi:hypothetical protein